MNPSYSFLPSSSYITPYPNGFPFFTYPSHLFPFTSKSITSSTQFIFTSSPFSYIIISFLIKSIIVTRLTLFNQSITKHFSFHSIIPYDCSLPISYTIMESGWKWIFGLIRFDNNTRIRSHSSTFLPLPFSSYRMSISFRSSQMDFTFTPFSYTHSPIHFPFSYSIQRPFLSFKPSSY